MSVAGKSVKDVRPVEAVQPVALYDPATGLPASGGGGGGGGTDASPNVTRSAQGTITQTTVNLTANTAATIIAASATLRGARILNWIAAPIFMTNGVSGTPASGAPSDYIPAAAAGPIPSQFEFPYAPINGVRAVSAVTGTLTVETW